MEGRIIPTNFEIWAGTHSCYSSSNPILFAFAVSSVMSCQGIANLSIQIVNFGCFRFAIIMVNHYDWSVLFVSVNLTSVALVLLRLHVDVSFLAASL